MKKYWKEIAVLTAQLLMFYAFPLMAGPTDAMGMVFLIIVATFMLGLIMGIVSKEKIKYLYSLLVAILFVPSVFIYYNESALIHSVWYFVVSSAGLLIGALIHHFFIKKWIALVLSLTCVLALVGCNNKSMNYIISNKPSVTGIVEEVHDDYIIMYSETAEGYPNGSRWNVPLEVENQDSYTDVVVGDEIVVYYDGSAMETDPLQIATVYAITLKEPAERARNEKS